MDNYMTTGIRQTSAWAWERMNKKFSKDDIISLHVMIAEGRKRNVICAKFGITYKTLKKILKLTAADGSLI